LTKLLPMFDGGLVFWAFCIRRSANGATAKIFEPWP